MRSSDELCLDGSMIFASPIPPPASGAPTSAGRFHALETALCLSAAAVTRTTQLPNLCIVKSRRTSRSTYSPTFCSVPHPAHARLCRFSQGDKTTAMWRPAVVVEHVKEGGAVQEIKVTSIQRLTLSVYTLCVLVRRHLVPDFYGLRSKRKCLPQTLT